MQNKLILGTVQFGLPYGINNQKGLLPEEKVHDILQKADALGINTLDTASAYGEAEKRIGTFHKNKPLTFNVITKFSKTKGETWENSFRTSLDKMNLNNVDTVMFHSYEGFLENKENIKYTVSTSKDQLFKKLGVSVYTNQELTALKDEDDIDVIQLPFNMLDNEIQRGSILRDLKNLDKEIHTRSCFLQGLFFMEANDLVGNLEPLRPFLEQIKDIAKKFKLETGHLALQYVLNKNYIDGVLFGVDSIEQLEQNVQWSNKKISEEVLIQVDNIDVPYPILLNPSQW